MVVERSVSALRQTLVDIAEDGEFGIWKKLVKNLELQRRVILRFVDDHLADAAPGAVAIELEMEIEQTDGVVKSNAAVIESGQGTATDRDEICPAARLNQNSDLPARDGCRAQAN